MVFGAGVRERLRRSLVGSFANNLECCCSLSSLLQGLLCLMHAYTRDHGTASFCFFIVSGIMSLVALFRACDCVGGEPSQAPVVLLVARQLHLVLIWCISVCQAAASDPSRRLLGQCGSALLVRSPAALSFTVRKLYSR